MVLAEADNAGRIMDAISDHVWPYGWCQVELFGVQITLMSSSIISMVITAAVLIAVIVPIARKHRTFPRGSANVLEVLVLFVRDMIARPALGEKAYEFMPFLLTLFTYILGMNLLGMVPLEAISYTTGLPLMGHTATSIPAVTAALASMAFLTIVFLGLRNRARYWHEHHGWPMWLCVLLSPVLWLVSLSPNIPGVTGRLMAVPLAILELLGAVAKCFALMVRLTANMLSGHMVLALMMMFVFMTIRAWWETQAPHLLYVGPLVILGSVAINVLELLVAGLQAYIFTFLTAMFLGLYAESSH